MSIPASDVAPAPPPAPVHSASYESPIRVERRDSEIPLVIITGFISLGVWALATISVFGLVYAAIIAVFFFLGHVAFVAHVRGSAVRLGDDQFPELFATVRTLSRRMGLRRVPEVYLMEAGGTLNALAAKFLRSNIVVLFSDLIDACGADTAARDMIIAHELGHIRAGHLRWAWFLLPGSIVPFLGTALSRAREYTADRYGLAGAGNRQSALTGLAILAAGAQHGPRVNREALVRQRNDLNTGWMRLGEWFSTHPPLARRMAALDPALDALPSADTAGTVRALAIIGAAVLVPIFASVAAFSMLMGMAAQMAANTDTLGGPVAIEAAEVDDPAAAYAAVAEEERQDAGPAADPAGPSAGLSVATELAMLQMQADLQTFADAIRKAVAGGRASPESTEALYDLFAAHPEGTAPLDPFLGARYTLERLGENKLALRSVGPDKLLNTADDIVTTLF